MRRLTVFAILVASLAACGGEELTPTQRLQGAIRTTEEARTFTFTLDGEGEVTRGTDREELFFGATGEVRFPDRVHMIVSIDQPKGGVRSELRQIAGIVYVRGSPQDRWKRSQGSVELAGFDPLASFDFKALSDTRVARDGGRDIVDGVPSRKIRLIAKESYRKDVQSKLPAGFENTTLEIGSDIWISIATSRIVRVEQRYEYAGATRGHFVTDLRLDDFGRRVTIEAPAQDELSTEPLILQTPAPRASP